MASRWSRWWTRSSSSSLASRLGVGALELVEKGHAVDEVIRRLKPEDGLIDYRQLGIVDTSGRVLGTHEGHQHFTVGQRRGVGVAMGYPIYVVDKDARTNTVTVGTRDELRAEVCRARETNWFIEPS